MNGKLLLRRQGSVFSRMMTPSWGAPSQTEFCLSGKGSGLLLSAFWGDSYFPSFFLFILSFLPHLFLCQTLPLFLAAEHRRSYLRIAAASPSACSLQLHQIGPTARGSSGTQHLFESATVSAATSSGSRVHSG